MVSTPLKNISHIGSFGSLPQVRLEITNIWNHHPEIHDPKLPTAHHSTTKCTLPSEIPGAHCHSVGVAAHASAGASGVFKASLGSKNFCFWWKVYDHQPTKSSFRKGFVDNQCIKPLFLGSSGRCRNKTKRTCGNHPVLEGPMILRGKE